jgi:[CysO sulfur-carrier protein]-S-L-cysteine hydrolase
VTTTLFPSANASVKVTRSVMDALLAEARSDPLVECCGLLAGTEEVISAILPAKNALQSERAYEIGPAELFALFRRMRSEGVEHQGIYHSHPRGENAPSPRDIECAFYPEAIYFILSPRAEVAQPVRAFRIADGIVAELKVECVP